MPNYRPFILMLTVALLAGCDSYESLSTPSAQDVVPTALASPSTSMPPMATTILTRQSTSIITLTPIEPTATSILALPPDNVLKYQRVDVAPSLPSDATPGGTLVLSGQHSYFLNFDQGIQQEISEENSCLSTSPDGKWLAYCQFSDDSPTGVWLIVESATGQQMGKLPMKQEWEFFTAITWLDKERLVFNLWEDKSVIPVAYPVVVVNPFTGEQQELLSDYPELKSSLSGPAGTLHFIYSTVVYDPSLNLVIYPQTTTDSFYVVLWDREAQKALARIKDLGNFQHTPLWSPDRQQFVVAVTYQDGKQPGEWLDEWFSVSREGQIQQLTHFGDFFGHAEIGAANWSPDGRRLAFWLETKPSLCEGQHLAVLEMGTQQVTDYCVPGSIHGDAPPPVWAPDSRYIAVQNYYQEGSSRVILVDTKAGWAAQIGENVQPVGWLAAP